MIRRIWSSPWVLLLCTGILLGMSLPLGKLASQEAIAPVTWALVVSAGVVIGLSPLLFVLGQARWPTLERLRYFVVTALLSYVVPNLLLFTVMPQVGTGYAGIMFTLSPIITLLIGLVLRLKPVGSLALVGIGLGCIGAIIVASTRGGLSQPASAVWVLLALLLPVSLAAGNIYRSLDWPIGGQPIELAVGSHAAALVLLVIAGIASDGVNPVAAAKTLPLVTIAQMLTAAAMFIFFFRLQTVGGPLYLSQIGYVAAAVGLVFGTFAFGESYGITTWAGAGLIVAGVILTTVAQVNEAAASAKDG